MGERWRGRNDGEFQARVRDQNGWIDGGNWRGAFVCVCALRAPCASIYVYSTKNVFF